MSDSKDSYDIVDYKKDIPNYVDEWMLQQGIDKLSQGQFNACLIDINNRYIQPVFDTVTSRGCKGYSVDDIRVLKSLTDIFIYTCFKYNKRCDLYGFSLFSGLDYETLKEWLYGENLTSEKTEIIKKIISADEEGLTGGLSDGTGNPIGKIFLLKNKHGYTDTRVLQQRTEQPTLNLDDIAEKLGVSLLSG